MSRKARRTITFTGMISHNIAIADGGGNVN
jgi:hypothetical protein